MWRDRARRRVPSTSPATSGRSSRTSASRATAPTPASARRSCGSTRAEGATAPAAVGRAGDRPRQAGRERACRADHRRPTPTSVMPPGEAAARRSRRPRSPSSTPWIARGRQLPAALGVRRRRSGPPLPAVKRPDWVPQPDRPLRPRPARDGGADALARGRPGHAAPPAQPRPDRPAADARGGRRLPRRQRRRTPTRRLVDRLLASPHYGERWGRHLARRRPLRRLATATRRTSRGTSGSTATGSSTPSTATCPTTSSSSSRSPATCCPNADAGPGRRHRLPAQLDDQRGRRRRSRAVPHGGDVRPHGRHRQGRPRPDHPVRPVPQPQVRPAHAGRVLPDVRLPQQRPRGRTSPSTRPTSR